MTAHARFYLWFYFKFRTHFSLLITGHNFFIHIYPHSLVYLQGTFSLLFSWRMRAFQLFRRVRQKPRMRYGFFSDFFSQCFSSYLFANCVILQTFDVSPVFTLFTEISHQYPELLPAPQNVVLIFISIWYVEICFIQCWSHCTVCILSYWHKCFSNDSLHSVGLSYYLDFIFTSNWYFPCRFQLTYPTAVLKRNFLISNRSCLTCMISCGQHFTILSHYAFTFKLLHFTDCCVIQLLISQSIRQSDNQYI